MPDQTITCPYCNREIPLTETLSRQMRESVRKEFEQDARARETELKKREDELGRRAREIEEAKKTAEETIARRMAVEKARIAAQEEKKARQGVQGELQGLRERMAEKEKEAEQARNFEIELRRERQKFEDDKKRFELDVQRRLDAEREKIKSQAIEIFSEEHRLKDSEKDKKINDMLKTIEELKRKGEQGSMQTQGEVLEEELEELLKARFPVDVIEPVPKGIRGADILQRIYTRSGQSCGTIVWELKRTKLWSDDWISKLKDDQREVRAEMAVLVSEALPKDITTFRQVDGVWVSAIPFAVSLAEALRLGLIDVAKARVSAEGKGEKMETMYNYLCGPEFRQKVEAIVEGFRAMKEDLEKEKKFFIKNWAKREKQIERVVLNTVRMYGDMQGIIGASLPELASLELDSGDEDEEMI
ncbi:MAG: DUF2130 domain-containing protein [Thermodesulfobacteriota bacterium]